MPAMKNDELTLGETYFCVPRQGLEVRKAPRVSYAKEGESVVLTTDVMRRVLEGDLVVYARAEDVESVERTDEAPKPRTSKARASAALPAPTEEPAATAAEPDARERPQGE